MKFAICISSYSMPEFVCLNVIQSKLVFGADTPILISDDLSVNTPQIENVAYQYGCSFIGSKTRRNHFAGDLQSVVNGLAFAESVGADVMCKLSMRLILLDQTLKNVFVDRFQNHDCHLALPPKVSPGQLIRRESSTFCALPLLTDVMLLRVGSVQPEKLIQMYRYKQEHETVKHKSLIEALFADLHHGKFKDHSILLDELAVHQPNQPHRYLRKAQNNRVEYLDLARKHGISGQWDTREWSQILGATYNPRPQNI